jgi:asparagine synthase (glutamine-hydrolysing)
MCRIAGIIGLKSSRLEDDIKLMTTSMEKGGPDGFGYYIDRDYPLAFGHRRLSIIDVTDSGKQPMSDMSANIVITFNGEIYNFQSLKNDLINKGYYFKSQTDTEVIINGYLEWGIEGLLCRLNGMFAFLLFDKGKKKVYAARDHAGIKPLYYSFYSGVLFFSSEIKGFKSLNKYWSENPEWGVWFLSFGYIPEPFTTLEKVLHLERGSFLEYDLKEFSYKVIKYYHENIDYRIFNITDALNQVRETVTNSIQSQLISDVPVGVFLSGGLDSSIISSVAQKYGNKKVVHLSLVFDDDELSEKKYQILLEKKIGGEHKRLTITKEMYENELPIIYESMDQPTIDGINTYFISKFARSIGVKVALSGLGADEIFGGYNSFYRNQNRIKVLSSVYNNFNLFNRSYPLKKFEFFEKQRWYNDYLFNRGLFVPSDVSKITGFSVEQVHVILNKLIKPNYYDSLEYKNKISFLESSFYMQSQLLHDCDSFSMCHGLEVRVPFLDRNVVELTRSIHPDIKYNFNVKKHLLVDAFKTILPNEIFSRNKMGFEIPVKKWFYSNVIFNNEIFFSKHLKSRFLKRKLNYSQIWAIFIQKCFGLTLDNALKFSSSPPDTLFIFLTAFSTTGGIEQVNKTILKILKDNENSKSLSEAISLTDYFNDNYFYNRYRFHGFNNRKFDFLKNLLFKKIPWKRVIIGHVNLLPIVWILKKRKPEIEIILIVHGIEVWKPLGFLNNLFLRNVNKVISVSEFTKNQIIKYNRIDPNKISVQKNCISPVFTLPDKLEKPSYLLKRYKIKSKNIVLTISRFSLLDRYKGYINMLFVIKELRSSIPDILYLLCGKITEDEKIFIEYNIKKLGITNNVKIIGFINDDELIDHYLLGDVLAMPSKKEGFGISFIEAAALGLTVVAGNQDGSTEALLNGKIGLLVDPSDHDQIVNAVEYALKNPFDKNVLQELVMKNYSYTVYKKNSII